MKVQRQNILNELMPGLNTIAQMQKNGMVGLPPKVAYALAKCLTEGIKMQKLFDEYKHGLLIKNVESEGNKFLTTDKNVGSNEKPMKEWKYKSEKCKQDFENGITDWAEEEIEWNPHKISQEDLKQVHNLPIDTLYLLEAYEITTELLQPKLSLIN